MNLDMSLLGWAHSLACLSALALGPAAFLQRKGSAPHIALGRGYASARCGRWWRQRTAR
jgi:uncharacterized membrane protein